MTSCFNFDRCRGEHVLVYIYPDSTARLKRAALGAPRLRQDYLTILDALHRTGRVTEDPNEACVFIPPFSTMCTENDCDPSEPFMMHLLHQLPFWQPNGQNHLLFGISDHDYMPYDGEQAMYARSSFHRQHFRSKFDFSIPLLPATDVTVPNPSMIPPIANRSMNVFFKGEVGLTKMIRKSLVKIHDPQSIVICMFCHPNEIQDLGQEYCANLKQFADKYNYKTALLDSKFGIAIRGMGLHSYRLAETLALGAIPIIIADDYVLPFEDSLCWEDFSVIVMERDIDRIPEIIARYSEEELQAMQERALAVFRDHLSSWENVIRGVLDDLQIRLDRYLGKRVYRKQCAGPPASYTAKLLSKQPQAVKGSGAGNGNPKITVSNEPL